MTRDDDDDDDDYNNNNNKITFLFIDVLIQGQMINYRNNTTYRHKLTKDNKQNTNEINAQKRNTRQTKQIQYGRKINIKY